MNKQKIDQLIAAQRAKIEAKKASLLQSPLLPAVMQQVGQRINKTEKEIEHAKEREDHDIARFQSDGNFEAIKSFTTSQPTQIQPTSQEDLQTTLRESAKIDVILNTDQQRALDAALAGKSFCLIGAAGTGKTTCMRIILQTMRDRGLISPLTASSKYLTEGAPSIVVLSYTNKAVANIKRGMPKDVACVTAHKLIEFEPKFYEVLNVDGDLVKTMRFEPNRHRFNRLPHIDVTCFEESSTISTILHQQIEEARNGGGQVIYMGDIQQLPPVYGQAILGFKMLELPMIELSQVMRQALESRVLGFAWKILEGKPLKIKQISKEFDKEGEFKIRPWKKRLNPFDAMYIASLLINQFIDSGDYKPLEDMILIPFAKNKSSANYFCTDELNTSIAQKLGEQRKAKVHEIIAGFHKFYYAVGDKVLVRKQEAIIESISINADYIGKVPLDPSEKLNRQGHYTFDTKEEAASLSTQTMSVDDLEIMMAAASLDSGEIEERKNQASHILHCRMLDDPDQEEEVQTTGEYAETSFAYALTIHKAQGSEWKRVILLLHNSHNTMISRELLYTAVTRARESLYIICEPEHFEKGILRQRIRGNTLEEKAEFFKGKQQINGDMENA